MINNAECYDCKLPYEDPGFQDLIIPAWAWQQIAPDGNGSGLLCPTCICRRLAEAGIKNCPSKFASGALVIDEKGNTGTPEGNAGVLDTGLS